MLALGLLLLTLAARLMVPTGFMPTRLGGQAVLAPCSGHGVMAAHHGGKEAKGDEQPCGFGALADAMTGGADPVLLLAALAFILSRAIRPHTPSPRAVPARLRPPLRAPPARLTR